MFTGIIEEVGSVTDVRRNSASSALSFSASRIFDDLKLGDSVAVNGVCLTVAALGRDTFSADVMHETLESSCLGELRQGSKVNLERAMPMNGRFGGHIVSGHIDGLGTITKIEKDDNAIWYTIRATEEILRYVVRKGSIAIDGISLTVSRLTDRELSVSIIPHTAEETTLALRQVGDRVNLENDVIGKYVERLLALPSGAAGDCTAAASAITAEFLVENGY